MSGAYRDMYDALQRMVPRSEHGRCALHLQQIGHWPANLSPESARARMSACLDASKPEKLSPQDVLALMAFTGRYDPHHYSADRLGLHRGAPINAEQAMLKAAEDLRGMLETGRATLENIMRTMETVRAAAARESHAAHFSMPADDESPEYTV